MFKSNKEREECYRMLQRMITNDRTLRPLNMDKKTHLVSDASPEGITASLYQEDQEGCWVPVDYCHRELSVAEKGWRSQKSGRVRGRSGEWSSSGYT